MKVGEEYMEVHEGRNSLPPIFLKFWRLLLPAPQQFSKFRN